MNDQELNKLNIALTLTAVSYIADRLKAITDQLDVIAGRYESLFNRSEQFFLEMKRQFLEDVLKQEVELLHKKCMGRGSRKTR